jgi:uncharacterized protein (DUF4415 family)
MAKKNYGTSLLQDVKGSQGSYIDPLDVDKEVAQGEFSKQTPKKTERPRYAEAKKMTSVLIEKETLEKYKVLAKRNYGASFNWLVNMALREFCENHGHNLDDIEV